MLPLAGPNQLRVEMGGVAVLARLPFADFVIRDGHGSKRFVP